MQVPPGQPTHTGGPPDLAALAADTGRVVTVLSHGLASNLSLQHCELLKMTKGAGDDRLIASYRVTFYDADIGRRIVQFYCGHLLQDAAALFGEWRGRPLVPVEVGAAVLYNADLRLVLFAFPNDPELPSLAACLSGDAVEACRHHHDALGRGRLLGFEVMPLKHDPGRSCTCALTISVEHEGLIRRHEVIAKMHRTDRLARTFATMTRLQDDPSLPSRAVILAEPLFYDAGRRLLWQRKLPGRSFWSLYPDLSVTEVFRAMARVAAALHATKFAPAGRTIDSLPVVRDDAIDTAHPNLRARRMALWRRLQAVSATLSPAQPISVHGDFHPDQFLIDGDRLGLTDLDSAAWGDAACDPARFVSHVILKALQRDLDPGIFEDPLEAFMDAYLEAAPVAVTEQRVCWHVAAQLLGRRIHKLMVQPGASSGTRVDHMLHVAERYLERSATSASDRN
jgi:aminoglycoside phosphotransferase (APT) family kinase protein